MVVVSVASDLHLEFGDIVLPGGDILLLCGDTFVANRLEEAKNDADRRAQKKRYRKFCAEELRKYWKVLAIAGNHEFYHGVIPDELELIRDLFSEYAPNATLLDNEHVEIEGVRFIGSTLWATHGCGTGNHLLIQQGMNDFRCIHVRDEEDPSGFRTRKFTVNDANRLHQEAVEFLKEAVKTELPCVIMTHHAPSYLVANRKRYPNQDMDDAYYSNQHALIEDNPGIKCWVFGHNHYRCRRKLGETWLVSNPRGYYGHERMSLAFDSTEADFRLKTFEFVDAK